MLADSTWTVTTGISAQSMTDVFISYASEDRERARVLAIALEARGWSVWWDRKIVPGQSFDQVIERALETAKSVVVLWSENSITSDWVKNEAAAAAERGVLVPSLIKNIKLPLEFRHKQAANLVGWEGDLSHEGFQALCNGITTTITGVAQPQPTFTPRRESRWNHRWTLGAIVAIAIAIAIAIASGITYFVRDTWQPPDTIEHPIDTRPTPGPREEIYSRLAEAQGRGLEMLAQRNPEALAHIDENLRESDAAIRTFPDDPRFHILKGYILKDVYQSPSSKLLLRSEQRREYLLRARESAEQALRLDPGNAAAHNLMGNVLYFEGDCLAAIREYDIALERNREDWFTSVIEGDKHLALQKLESNTCPEH